MSMHNVHAWCPQGSEEAVDAQELELGILCELPYGCWELNISPLEEQRVLLTTESLIQPPRGVIVNRRVDPGHTFLSFPCHK